MLRVGSDRVGGFATSLVSWWAGGPVGTLAHLGSAVASLLLGLPLGGERFTRSAGGTGVHTRLIRSDGYADAVAFAIAPIRREPVGYGTSSRGSLASAGARPPARPSAFQALRVSYPESGVRTELDLTCF